MESLSSRARTRLHKEASKLVFLETETSGREADASGAAGRAADSSGAAGPG